MKKPTRNDRNPLRGCDAELNAMLPTMKVDGWETRRSSGGAVKLYIRCSPLVPATKIIVTK